MMITHDIHSLHIVQALCFHMAFVRHRIGPVVSLTVLLGP